MASETADSPLWDDDHQRDPAFWTYRNPTSGTVHVLRSNPRQKTLEYPRETHFHAIGFCGRGQQPLDAGDLTPHYTPLDLDEIRDDLCGNCERCVPVLYITLRD